MNDLKVNVSQIINAPIKQVFDAWLDPDTLQQFILPMPGMPAPQVENDPREGGNFTIIMQVGDQKVPHTGEYLIIDHPTKLVFTWNSPVSVEGSEVALSFEALSDHKTRVNLSHTKFIDQEHRTNHQGGWENILQSLQAALVDSG